MRGDTLEIGRIIEGGKGIVPPANPGDRPGEFTRLLCFRPLKQKMFQKMGEPGFTRRFVSRSDPVPKHLHDDRRAVIFYNYDF